MESEEKQRRTGRHIFLRQKGVSITERPESVDSREAFGHWEGDLVTGPRDGQNGAYLTFVGKKNSILLYDPYFFQIF